MLPPRETSGLTVGTSLLATNLKARSCLEVGRLQAGSYTSVPKWRQPRALFAVDAALGQFGRVQQLLQLVFRQAGGLQRHVHDRALLLVGLLGRGRDRKSTRLNSSHVAISYAVFGLKTK